MRFVKLLAVVCLLAALGAAQTSTNVGLYLPSTHATSGPWGSTWDKAYDYNWRLLDNIFGGSITVPAFTVTSLSVMGTCTGCGISTSSANTYSFGAKQTFSASATTAGMNFRAAGGANPSSLANGDLYYDFSRYTGAAGMAFYDGATSQSLAFVSDFARPPVIGNTTPNVGWFSAANSASGSNPYNINMTSGSGTGGLKVGTGGSSPFLQFYVNTAVGSVLLDDYGSATVVDYQCNVRYSLHSCGYRWFDQGSGYYSHMEATYGVPGVKLNYYDGTGDNQVLVAAGGASNTDTFLGATGNGGYVWLNTGQTSSGTGAGIRCGKGTAYSFGYVCSIDNSGNATFSGAVTGVGIVSTAAVTAASYSEFTGGLNIDTSFGGDGSGHKHHRFTSPCSTAATAGATCTSTYSWNTTFANANYTPVCSGIGPTNPAALNVSSYTASGVTIQIVAITAAAASYSKIDCVADHD